MEADRFAKLLVTNCPNELQTHLLAFSVAIRRGSTFLCPFVIFAALHSCSSSAVSLL